MAAAYGSSGPYAAKFAVSQGVHILKPAKSCAHPHRTLACMTVDGGRHGPFGINIGLWCGTELR